MQHDALPLQLAREGDMMLSALLVDLLDAGVQHLLCTRDPRLPAGNLHVKTVLAENNIRDTWRRCMQESEVAWIIAPETDGVLYELTQMAYASGCMVVGCTPETVRIAASKNKTIAHLANNGIPCIPVINDLDTIPDCRTGWVVKPDDGVGAEGCYHFTDIQQMRNYVKLQKRQVIVQEFIPGIAASMSLLCHEGKAQLLASNEQLFQFRGGKGHLQGVVVNGLKQYTSQFGDMGNDIAGSLPGLKGYVGIDVVISENGPLVVEINPRLTTAYTGLRHSLGINPAEWILSIFKTGHLPAPENTNGMPVTISI